MANPNRNKIPTKLIMVSTFRLIGFFLIHSIRQKITLQPSNAGIGNRLNTAKFTPINAKIFKNEAKPLDATSEVTLMVVTGPPIEVMASFPVKSSPSERISVPPILNEYTKDEPMVYEIFKHKITITTFNQKRILNQKVLNLNHF